MPASNDVTIAARRLMTAGDLPGADAILREALALAPASAELLYLRGVIANRRQDPATATGFLDAALAARPDMASAWLALGHARERLGASREAADAYERAAALEPRSADIHFNLGVVRRALGDLPGAARAFYAAWRRNPLLPNAAKACVGSLGLWVRSTPEAVPPMPARRTDPRAVSVIICSVDDAKAAHATALYTQLLAHVRHEMIVIRDAASLAEAYNRGVDRATGDVIVLSHDDIDILASEFATRLLAHLDTYDVVGVIGSNA